MSIIAVAIIDTSTFKPALIQWNYSANFKNVMVLIKEASYHLFKMKKRNNARKVLKLDSGFIIMHEDFWSQWILIAIFKSLIDPIQQRSCFERLKTLISQNKSLANINKKFNEVKLGIQDIMTGLDGIDRLSSKLNDQQTFAFSEYEKIMLSSRFSSKQKDFNLAEAKQAITRKFSKSSNPFGAYKENISNELTGFIENNKANK